MSLRLRSALPLIAIAAAVGAFFRHVLFVPGYVMPWDMSGFHLPLAVAYADALAEGVWPLWDPFSYCGRPLLANPQAAVFHPAMLLTALGGRDGILFRLEFTAIAQVALAGWLTFWLGRRLGLSACAATLSGLMFAVGGFPASQAQHWSLLAGMPWLALCWLALFAGSAWRIPLLAAALSLHLLAGFPAFTFAAAGSTVLLVLALRRPLLLLPVAAGGLLAALVCSAQLLPALELVQNSVGRFRTEWLQDGRGLPPSALISLIWPNYHGVFQPDQYHGSYPLTLMYLFSSITGLALAVVAPVLARARESRAIAIVSFACLVLMLGSFTPIASGLFRLLPRQVSNVIYWDLFTAPFLLGLSLLAGYGCQAVTGKPWVRAVLAFAVAAECIVISSNRPMNATNPGFHPLAGIDGSSSAEAALRRATAGARFDSSGDGLHLTSMAPALGIRSANGYDPLALERLIQFRLSFSPGYRWGAWYELTNLDSPIPRAAAVRAIITRNPIQHTNWRKYAELPGRHVYIDQASLPRYRLVWRVRNAASVQESARLLGIIDVASEAVAEGVELAGQQGPGTVRIVDETRQHIRLEVESGTPAFLVTAESHFPGWQARVDGVETPVYYTNVAFRGVAVPAGKHQIDLIFRSDALRLGLWLSAAGVLLWFATSIRACVRAGGTTERATPHLGEFS